MNVQLWNKGWKVRRGARRVAAAARIMYIRRERIRPPARISRRARGTIRRVHQT